MKFKVKIGTLVYKGKYYEKGSVIEIPKGDVEKFDRRDIKEVKPKKAEEK